MGYLQDHIARRFAEVMLYWRGHLKATEVQDYLGVSERSARSLISNWREIDGILPPYRPTKERRLVPSQEFAPGSDVTDPNIILSLLTADKHFPGNPFATVSLPNGGHDLSVTAPIRSKAFRELLAACLDHHPVWLFYAAKTGRQEFVFHPSALIRSRGRYHLRGYRSVGLSTDGHILEPRFIDIVPTRAIESQRREGIQFVGLEEDIDWNTIESRQYSLNTKLSEKERICYEIEYSIADSGILKVMQRRALIHYIEEELAERRCWRRDGTSVRIWEISYKV